MDSVPVLLAQEPEVGKIKIKNKSAYSFFNNGDYFKSYIAHLDAGVSQFIVRVLKMSGSTIICLNAKDTETLEELAVAMPGAGRASSPSSQIVSSTIMGGHNQTDSEVLAIKLSKRYGRQFFVSINMKLDRITQPLFEKTLITHIQHHLDQFV